MPAHYGRYVKPVGRQAAYEQYLETKKERRQRYNEWASRPTRSYEERAPREISNWTRNKWKREEALAKRKEEEEKIRKYYFYNPQSGKIEPKPAATSEWWHFDKLGFVDANRMLKAIEPMEKKEEFKKLKEHGWAKYGVRWPAIKQQRKLAASKQAAITKRNALPYSHPWKVAQRKKAAQAKRKPRKPAMDPDMTAYLARQPTLRRKVGYLNDISMGI